MTSKATTIEQYLAELSEERRDAVSAVRKVIKQNLPKGYEEQMLSGVICFCVPLSAYPEGYNRDPKVPIPYVSLASQKAYVALHLSGLSGDEEETKWFQEEYRKTGKRLDMGSVCVRFRKLDDIPLELIGRAVKRFSVKRFIAEYEAALAARTS